jgi:DnaK suppressor protein
MTPAQLARMRQRLVELRDGIVSEGDIQIEPVRKDVTEVGGDEDEQPLAEMSQVIASKRNRARTDVLALVQAALQRLDETPAEFGLCVECGDAIGRRLEAMPYVQLCIECQQDRDGAPDRGRRRHLTDFK